MFTFTGKFSKQRSTTVEVALYYRFKHIHTHTHTKLDYKESEATEKILESIK